MLTPKTKRNFFRILPFGIIWVVTGWIFLLIEITAIGPVENTPDTAIQMNIQIFLFATLAVFIVGILNGIIELLFLQKLFQQHTFIRKILYKMIFYLVLLFVIISLAYPIAASLEMNIPVFTAEIWHRSLAFLNSNTFASTMLQMGVTLFLCLFYSEISLHVGQPVIRNFFTGTYHKPVEETRVFMFLDMKSSTTIAEQLGHLTYFTLLKHYYADLSEAILNTQGEVYQYVGDELVVSWNLKSSNKKDLFIDCFFEMKRIMQKKGSWYQEKFGVRPTFKAGLHCGKVTVGEIGVLKKDILFTGDVLNATARIQALCNTYRVSILFSESLLGALQPHHAVTSLGVVSLRGRRKGIHLYTLT